MRLFCCWYLTLSKQKCYLSRARLHHGVHGSGHCGLDHVRHHPRHHGLVFMLANFCRVCCVAAGGVAAIRIAVTVRMFMAVSLKIAVTVQIVIGAHISVGVLCVSSIVVH